MTEKEYIVATSLQAIHIILTTLRQSSIPVAFPEGEDDRFLEICQLLESLRLDLGRAFDSFDLETK